jgi:hypothetical protein
VLESELAFELRELENALFVQPAVLWKLGEPCGQGIGLCDVAFVQLEVLLKGLIRDPLSPLKSKCLAL